MPTYNANYTAAPYQQPQMQQSQMPQAQAVQDAYQARIIPFTQTVSAWVPNQDIAGRMLVDPNKIAFMISEAENRIYVKTTDNIGKQSQLRIFEDVTPEQEPPKVDLSGYVTKQDFTDFTVRFGELEDKITRIFDGLSPKKRPRKEDIDDAE